MSTFKSGGTPDDSESAENKRKLDHDPILSNRIMI